MEGVIVHYRGSHKTQKTNQMIISIKGVSSMEKAKAFVGKSVVWTSPGKKDLKGKISSAHGNSGAVRAIFETGMPGQSIGQKVAIN